MVALVFFIIFFFVMGMSIRGYFLVSKLRDELDIEKGTMELYYLINSEAMGKSKQSFLELDSSKKLALYRSCIKNTRLAVVVIFSCTLFVMLAEAGGW
ncbi:hypothetical protein L1285_10715 [Pseudoalteromonas sp. DL2-H2.2]|uniref:hypothetical protein n=1 Tax=Pseudoalteromonas sp. DL2-H2.2 TaxID=2908889 RepID=UPI001F29747C|nr:hypothetical protein [Pseudoalteromonas sp. DL2-H2.2]MCF2908790.1 hypothetical protein [Pseudoalteromonas sp. DL2-H2.2]